MVAPFLPLQREYSVEEDATLLRGLLSLRVPGPSIMSHVLVVISVLFNVRLCNNPRDMEATSTYSRIYHLTVDDTYTILEVF